MNTLGPQTTSTYRDTPDRPAHNEAIDGLASLEQELNNLDKALSALHERLLFVLGPSCPTEAGGLIPICNTESGMGTLIQDRVRQVRSLTAEIYSIAERVRI